MLNNKGFAVSSVLYTLLIAFLLFLGAALAQFSTSSSLIGKANDDIVNGAQFDVIQVKSGNACQASNDWYKNNTLVRIKSRYGMMYWPKDFYEYDASTGLLGAPLQTIIKDGKTYAANKNIGILCSRDKTTWESCNGFNVSDYNNPVTTCEGTEIDGVCFSANELNNVKTNVESIYNKLKKDSISDEENPFLYRVTNENSIRGAADSGFNNTFANAIVKNYYALPNYNNLNTKFYMNEIDNYISICDGGNNTLYIDVQRLYNINPSTYVASIDCTNSGGTLNENIGSYKATNSSLINKYKNESLKPNTFPILYTDDITYGYISTEKKVYLLKDDKVVSINLDDLDSYISNASMTRSTNDTYFYIKVFDNVTADPDSLEDINTKVKGLYNICE